MGMIARLFELVFGGGRNVVAETAEVFRENAEGAAVRDHLRHAATMAQFGAEFLPGQRGLFDRIMDAVNRLPRPMMALGCLGLFVSAMIDPVWFATRMQGIALVPEPLWWLLGVIVSFYFGARHQMKGQEFQRSMAASLGQIARLREAAQSEVDISDDETNAALTAWRKTQ
ncbi:holin family protein [Cognatishimia activa]|uniref:Carboxylesterase n=1 Tax=Cognatishimia activa TaxID=1715691 RepID=A0A0P1IU68_9RHOB|nr:holin family protein [Cognatishimia activa]CUJ35763.1 hypothetical protein TA5113_03158 [Cognatishimia activa]CUK27025.1 hypothetical protein TA5114_02844 [Cognatishimia activa]